MKYSIQILLIIIVLLSSVGYSQYGYCNDGQGNDNNPCGLPEGNYQISNHKWYKSELKYFYVNGTNDIESDLEKQAFEAAFDKWAEAVPFDFVEVLSQNEADIKIVYLAYSDFSELMGHETSAYALAFQPENDCRGLLALNDGMRFSLEMNPSVTLQKEMEFYNFV
ncbi:MAG: matrixin family metalloprotease [Ignavibacterium sp.]|jgi:hypothetical protein|nr:matrixin family metalloprotease [Ignavibacterium sp.]